MGNVNVTGGSKKGPPVVCKGAPGGEAGLYAAHFEETDGARLVRLTKLTDSSSVALAYYLPWRDDDCTQAAIDLIKTPINYFFTAQLSGCSLWFKWSKPTVTILHEARTDESFQMQHLDQGYQLIAESQGAVQLDVDPTTESTSGTFYEVYASFAPNVATFHIQKIFFKKMGGIGALKQYRLIEDTLKAYQLS